MTLRQTPSYLQMFPDDEGISNFDLDSFIIPDIAETHSEPLCHGEGTKYKLLLHFLITMSWLKCLCYSLILLYFMCCETFVIFLKCFLCVFEGIKCQMLLPISRRVGKQRQVATCPCQPPQEVCVITASTQYGTIGKLLYIQCLPRFCVNGQCGPWPVLILQQQLVELLCLSTAVQVICLLQKLVFADTKPQPRLKNRHISSFVLLLALCLIQHAVEVLYLTTSTN